MLCAAIASAKPEPLQSKLPSLLIPKVVADSEAFVQRTMKDDEKWAVPGHRPTLVPLRSRAKPERMYNMTKRKHAGPRIRRPSKRKKLVNYAALGKVYKEGCDCGSHCLAEGTEAKGRLLEYREKNLKMNEGQVTEMMADIVKQFNPKTHTPLQYRIGIQSVCKYTFMQVYGLTEGKLKVIRQLAQSGKTKIVHGRLVGEDRETAKRRHGLTDGSSVGWHEMRTISLQGTTTCLIIFDGQTCMRKCAGTGAPKMGLVKVVVVVLLLLLLLLLL